MKINNSTLWSPFDLRTRCAGTFGFLLLGCVVRAALHPVLANHGFFAIFILVSICCAVLFGYRWALFAAVTGFAICSFAFVLPRFQFDSFNVHDAIALASYSGVVLSAIALIETLQRTLYAQKLTLKVLDSKNRMLLQQENRRMFADKVQGRQTQIMQEVMEGMDRLILVRMPDGSVRKGPALKTGSHRSDKAQATATRTRVVRMHPYEFEFDTRGELPTGTDR